MRKVWTLLAVIMLILGVTYNSIDSKVQDKEKLDLYDIIKDMQIDNSSGQNVDNIKNTQTDDVDKPVKKTDDSNDFKDEVVKQENKKETEEKEESAEIIKNIDTNAKDKNVVNEDVKKEDTKEKVNEEFVEEKNENIAEEEINAQKEENDDVVESLAISQDLISSVNSVLLAGEIEALKLILSKLTPSDIKMLKDMLNDGLTEEEKEKIIELTNSRFSEQEIELINKLYDKYIKSSKR
ncbi:hypothetical protein [Caloranaerobacter ferrireducens]|uniref:hypothetical protein n=1 Tax=Caloranaerobacter ferrireducens TaxID=1323370 RepID=UPI00084D7B1A|nr:hypothetical protein [Caloranaerobacter ferrireducens]